MPTPDLISTHRTPVTSTNTGNEKWIPRPTSNEPYLVPSPGKHTYSCWGGKDAWFFFEESFFVPKIELIPKPIWVGAESTWFLPGKIHAKHCPIPASFYFLQPFLFTFPNYAYSPGPGNLAWFSLKQDQLSHFTGPAWELPHEKCKFANHRSCQCNINAKCIYGERKSYVRLKT